MGPRVFVGGETWFGGFLQIIVVVVLLGLFPVYIGVFEGDIRPMLIWLVLLLVFIAVYLYAKRPRTVLAYPDRPFNLPTGSPRPVIILRDKCQFEGCTAKTSLSQCKGCRRTFCSGHLEEHMRTCKRVRLRDWNRRGKLVLLLTDYGERHIVDQMERETLTNRGP